MTETHTDYEGGSTVDDMAERIAKQLTSDRAMRKGLAAERDEITARIKQLDADIDKAERMTKAIVPRHRNRTTSTLIGEAD